MNWLNRCKTCFFHENVWGLITSPPDKVYLHAYGHELFLLLSLTYNLQSYKITQRQGNCRDNLEKCAIKTSNHLLCSFQRHFEGTDVLPLTVSVSALPYKLAGVPFPCLVVCDYIAWAPNHPGIAGPSIL